MLTLIDAGVKTKEAWEVLKSGLRQLGYGPEDVEQVVLTHHHPDHTGLVDEFPRAQYISGDEGLQPWLMRDETYLQRYEQFFYDLFNQCSIPEEYHNALHGLRAPLVYSGIGELTTPLHEGENLPGHPGWEVIETKGHAQTHLSFWRPQSGVLVGGDHLLHHISPNPLIEPGNPRPKPLLQYRENVRKCVGLGVSQVLPGHGRCFSDVRETTDKQLKKQEERADQVLKLLHQKALTPFDICRAIFPRQYEKQLNLTMSETLGQIDFLEDQGLIQPLEDQKLIYQAIPVSQ
ncbi:Hydroxyacylglutathione hydrolase [Lentibacillus sp. JNUCC-1]|uniref:MBL fold metallo-hydrolase n=1 Tax=Lentibacillus sp. JNUCC-1 TaxID=2654513 RepID=UPI001322B599|nr:MBL fold metallo-hydrolase [Lentibacillus sp. JNUCC-1]MUV39712.1 Hydroxyacylglutathione hydrolase [Lentibacillus sp. JNUCC-1]